MCFLFCVQACVCVFMYVCACASLREFPSVSLFVRLCFILCILLCACAFVLRINVCYI